MTGPFDDFEGDDEDGEEEIARQLAAVEALDGLDQDVTSYEADFLESCIRRLRNEKLPLTERMLAVLKSMCRQYEVDY